MSRIDDLIAEHCPDGVPFSNIGSVADVLAGATPSKSNPAYWMNGTIPWLSSGEVNKGTIYEAETKISRAGYDSCSTRLVPPNSVVVALAGQGKTRGMVARTRLECCTNQSLASIVPSDVLDSDFLYHYMRTQYQRLREISSGGGTRGGLNLAMIRGYRIPMPPLVVQREVASILDKIESLQAELEAEREARSRQYAFYRESLFTFDASDDVAWATLGDVCTSVFSGGTPLTTKDEYYGGNIPWLRTQEVGYADIADTDVKITKAGFENSSAKWVRPNSVIVAISGAGVTRGRAAVNRIALTTNQHCCNLEIDGARAKYRYVYYWLLSHYDDLRSRGHGNRSDLNVGIIKNYPIAVPSLQEQARIVDILDKFDALVNDFSIGLPAEIKARRLQYEHYRDKLLSFRERAA